MSKLNDEHPVVIVVPPLLAEVIARLEGNWKRAFGADDRRSVEVAILQRGIRSVQAELEGHLKFGREMGWSEDEVEAPF